jgi:adenylate cyclase
VGAWQSFSGRIRNPLAVTGLVVIAVGLGVWGLRSARLLESFETAAYDWFIRLRPTASAPDPRVTLITITEADIQDQGGWPLSDDVIARTLNTLLRYEPRAIGLDIYRDIPVPPGTDKLNATFKDPRIIVVTKFAEGASPGVRPPPVLRGAEHTEQVGFNDIVVDPGGTVRRGLIFLDDGRTTLYSFALRLALLYSRAEGVTPQADPSDPRYLRLGRVTIRPLEPNDGGYVAADTRGYQFLLDFRDGPGLFPAVNLATLLTGRADPRLIRGKIVLIGIVAESIKDDFYTPYSGGFEVARHVPGVAIHATIASQLSRIGLDGIAPMAAPTEATKVIWIFLWSALGGMVGFRLRSPVLLALAASGGLLALGLADFVLFLRGWWIPLVPPALTWLLSAAAVTAYLSRQETLERAELMRLFSRHVSKEVAEAMWQQRDQFVDGSRPRPQGMIATALFTDLTGYSTVSERLTPELLMEWLNEYMETMAGEVSRCGGVIKQYAGDSIVAIFGAPVVRHSEDEIAQDAINAVSCALGMETALRELNRQWRAEHRPTTGMRVGIFTGPVVAGTLGSAERSEYVVVGDAVNTASRLESLDKDLLPPDPDVNPCRILIGESTWRYLADRFETERVGDFGLKGKEHKVGVYRVIGRSRADRPELTQEVER